MEERITFISTRTEAVGGSKNNMDIQEDIFEEFFEKLEEHEEFSPLVLGELKKLWESGEIASRERILQAIEKGCENAS